MSKHHEVRHPPEVHTCSARRLAAGARAIVAHRDPRLRGHVARLLRADGFEVSVVDDGYAVVRQLASWMLQDGRTADLVLAGTNLRGWGGADLATYLPYTDWAPQVLLVLDTEEMHQHPDARQEQRAGTPLALRMPFEDDDLRTIALCLLRQKQRQGRRARRPDRFAARNSGPAKRARRQPST